MASSSKTFTQSVLSASIATILATSATPVMAQGSDEAIEEVVVVGIRGSLTNSMDIKRASSGVVDAISIEDIGKFPDTNLAESLQRITGVSIDRANNEGNQVTVRGFGPSFNLVTLNGRQMPNSSSLDAAGISRSFNFREIAAESVSGVEVYKTGKAHVYSGGIGSTINIKTAKPFDYNGFIAAVSGSAVLDTSVVKGDDATPEISGLISQTFADGKFGVLLAASHAERDSRQDRVGTQGWVRNRAGLNPAGLDKSAIDLSRNPTGSYWAPWTVDLETRDYERERQNGQLVLQFAPTDAVTATVDYMVSRFEEVGAMNRQSFWFDNVTGATDSNGVVAEMFSAPGDLDFWAWEFLDQKENDSIGLNIDWQATDDLSFVLDFHDSTSKSNPDGDTAETLSNLRNPIGSVASVAADFLGNLPAISFDDSTLPGGAFNTANIVADLYQKRGRVMDNNIQQIQLGGKWNNGSDGALTSINFGISNTDYNFDASRDAIFKFVSPPSINLDLTPLGLTFVPRGSTGDQLSGIENLFPVIPQYSVHDLIAIVQAAGEFTPPNRTTSGVQEETLAAHVSFEFDTEFNGMPVNLNVGVRWEDTDVTAYSIQPGIVALNFRVDEELQPIFASEATPQQLTGSYTRVLPNVDFSMDVTDEVVARFSYGTTLARASVGGMFPATNLSAPRPGDVYRASQGNPNLLPLTSDNLDFSLEWYYDEGSYASVGYFRKYVENFIGSGVENRTIADVNGDPLTDPSANPRAGCPDSVEPPNPACLSQPGDPVIIWEVSTPDNLDDRVVDGWELNVQHIFGDTGFGVVANATFVSTDEEFDVFNFDQTIGLTGLSDSANLVGFYETDRWQGRVAYNWRDDFLLSLGNEPVFTEAYGQWDISGSFNLNETVTFFVEGLNVTNETTRRHGRFKNQLVDAEQYGPRYNIGVRAKF